MSKVLAFEQAHDLGKLHDELLAAIPALRPRRGADGINIAVFSLSGAGDELRVEVPDDVVEQDVAAVLKGHDPTPPPRTRSPKELAKDALSGYDETKPAATLRKIKAALDLLLAD